MRRARLRLAPINTGLYVQGASTRENVDFFSARAEGGVDMCMVGNIATTPNTVPNGSTGVMSDNHCWSHLAAQIRKAGSIPAIQLGATLPDFKGQRAFYTLEAEAEIRRYQTLFATISESDWQALGDKFIQAIELSLNHGFEHVQLHAAHGYAFSLVLDPQINPDGRGLDVLMSLLNLLSSNNQLSTSLRVSWYTGLSYDHERQARLLEVWSPFRDRIELDLSNGYYNLDKRHIYPPHQKGQAPFLNYAISLAIRFPDASFVMAGNIWEPYKLLEEIPTNLNLSIARALIADPHYLMRDRKDKSVPMVCDDCGMCHFFSKGECNIICPKWPNHALP